MQGKHRGISDQTGNLSGCPSGGEWSRGGQGSSVLLPHPPRSATSKPRGFGVLPNDTNLACRERERPRSWHPAHAQRLAPNVLAPAWRHELAQTREVAPTMDQVGMQAELLINAQVEIAQRWSNPGRSRRSITLEITMQLVETGLNLASFDKHGAISTWEQSPRHGPMTCGAGSGSAMDHFLRDFDQFGSEFGQFCTITTDPAHHAAHRRGKESRRSDDVFGNMIRQPRVECPRIEVGRTDQETESYKVRFRATGALCAARCCGAQVTPKVLVVPPPQVAQTWSRSSRIGQIRPKAVDIDPCFADSGPTLPVVFASDLVAIWPTSVLNW